MDKRWIKDGQNWTKLDKTGQNWTKTGQNWTKMDKKWTKNFERTFFGDLAKNVAIRIFLCFLFKFVLEKPHVDSREQKYPFWDGLNWSCWSTRGFSDAKYVSHRLGEFNASFFAGIRKYYFEVFGKAILHQRLKSPFSRMKILEDNTWHSPCAKRHPSSAGAKKRRLHINFTRAVWIWNLKKLDLQ